MQSVLSILEDDDDVIGYAWMSSRNTHNTAAALVSGSGDATPLGLLYGAVLPEMEVTKAMMALVTANAEFNFN